MGLLLSVLVVCVGVLEVLACVRHFQDGYLPLWTPHCAVTSGYTASYERWRKKPSDSFEFRSFDDVSGVFNRTENQSLETSSNIQNGFTGKQIEKAGENNYPSNYQQSRNYSGNGLSRSIDDHPQEVLCYDNRPDILSSSLDYDEGEVKVSKKGSTDAISDIPHAEYDRKSQEAFAAEFTAELQSEKHPVSVSAQCGGLISRTQTESSVPRLSDSVLEETFSHDTGIEKYPVSTKEIDIQSGVPILNIGDKLHTSPFGSVNEQKFEGDSPDDILGGKCPAHRTFETEPELEIPPSNLYNSEVSNTKSTVGEPDGQVPIQEGKTNIPLSDFITEKCSSTVPELDQIPATEIQSQIPSSDFITEKSFSTTVEHKGHIPTTRSEINTLSSCLQREDDKSILGVAAGEPSNTTGEAFDKHQDGTITNSQDESTVQTILNLEQRQQNQFVPNSVSEETSVTTVKSSTQHSVPLSNDRIVSERTDIVNEKPFSSPELDNVRKELPYSHFHVEPEISLRAESAGQHLGTDVHKGIEALNSQVESSVSTNSTGNTTNIQQGLEDLKQENLQNVTAEDHPINETSLDLEEDGPGTQHDVLESHIGREPSSPDLRGEKQISIASDDAQQDVSESRLDSQTTLTDFVTSRDDSTPYEDDSTPNEDDNTPYEDDSGFPGSGSLTKHNVQESFGLQTSSITSVTPLTIDTSIQSSLSPPLTIDTSLETSASVTPLPTDHQPSLSPPKFPSTPRKSKADISWPTFFPGTPVIKRPSVSFATPESVFANEDDELLRQFVDEARTKSSCIKIPSDISSATESETTASTNEGKVLEPAGTPGRSDSFEEEEPVSAICREKSPSSIVSGNDFSGKELKLQRRKSYKQKRYSSAIEIRAQDEEVEDRSFSENNPELIRASSLKEPKKRHKKPAKASSFEDVMLRDIKTEGHGETSLTNTTEEITDVSVREVRETGSEETEQEEQEDIEAVAGETKGTSDITDCLRIRTERNDPKLNESKTQHSDDMIERKDATEGQKDEETRDDENSVSEEQSSSQQKSPPKEAFWVSSEDGTH
jgi:hypothetical protein